MKSEDVKPNKTLRGPLFPEPVQVIVALPMGNAIKVIGKGLNSKTVYEPVLTAGRTEALERFLVEDGAGNDSRFWTLAQALSALYPSATEEKRWVDSVPARKKGLGF